MGIENFINKTYCMDNLGLLKQLPNESIDLIYCDILYNTGKKFKDYDDNLGSPQEAVEWYRPRLIEMKRILKNTGSIYLQMDYRLVHYIKVEMDNIFGIKNFRNHLIWKYDSSCGALKNYPRKHDDILFYVKNHRMDYTFNKENTLVAYDDTKTRYNKYDKERDEWYKEYKMTDGTKKRCYKKKGKPTDIFEISFLQHNSKERVGYDTQKPKALLEKIIKVSSNEDDIVADFFMGSGTSMVVAKELGRNYIGCAINPRAIEITNQRLNED
jgi:DNA modification methylase